MGQLCNAEEGGQARSCGGVMSGGGTIVVSVEEGIGGLMRGMGERVQGVLYLPVLEELSMLMPGGELGAMGSIGATEGEGCTGWGTRHWKWMEGGVLVQIRRWQRRTWGETCGGGGGCGWCN